ncbi:tyrosinase family protein [uncultured Aquimarina sp.]|uniref:tyrosinase family protein n=1 Tax=uncultured Aquimarina sp. TaxID=575652 RepID=UPI00261C1BE5|nr:tyrosinase family protein [uncultured Aquimarina sp.]
MKDSKHTSRRAFIQKTGISVLGLPLVSSGVLGCKNNGAQKENTNSIAVPSNSIVVRRNIADIPVNDPEIQLLKDGITILKKRSEHSPLDPMGWNAHGLLHTAFCATSIYANQIHYNWYVWPWHRLYLWSLEQKLQKAVGEPKLALHYWDWTKENKIPEHFFGENNPLSNDYRQVGPEDTIPLDFMNVGAALRAKNYKTFGGHPAIKRKGEPQLDGIAEQTFHNNIHNWIGGQMASFSESGFDPIFYGHHGNCDRIWNAWQAYDTENQLPNEEEWLDKKLYVTDGNGKPVEFKIREVLNTENLGYTFENLDFNKSCENPLEEVDIPVRDKSANDAVMPLDTEASEMNAIYTQLDNKERTHIVIHFSRVQLPYHAYCARVYFEYTFQGKNVSKYSGTFTILPIQDLDSLFLASGVHLQVEIEKEVAEVIAAGIDVNVIFEPVSLPNRDISEGKLKLENVTLKLM